MRRFLVVAGAPVGMCLVVAGAAGRDVLRRRGGGSTRPACGGSANPSGCGIVDAGALVETEFIVCGAGSWGCGSLSGARLVVAA